MWKDKKKISIPSFFVNFYVKFPNFCVIINKKSLCFVLGNVDKSLKIMYNLSKGGALCFI